jgi:methyl-accepting chemotaxis protein
VAPGAHLLGPTGQALSGNVRKPSEIYTLISEIAQSSQEQATGLNQVNSAVNQMDQVTQQNAAMVEQATAAAANMRSESGALATLVSRFQTGEAVRRSGRPPASARPAEAPRPATRAVPQMRPGSNVAIAPEWEEF